MKEIRQVLQPYWKLDIEILFGECLHSGETRKFRVTQTNIILDSALFIYDNDEV